MAGCLCGKIEILSLELMANIKGNSTSEACERGWKTSGKAAIIGRMRDTRFIAEHRGGPLSQARHRSLMRWALSCAEHVLPLMRDGLDPRLQHALDIGRKWQAAEEPTGVAQKASVAAHAAARSYENPASVAVARSIAQAVAAAHFADHSLVAAVYALKAVKCAGGSVEDETAWQNAELGDDIRDIVLQSRKQRENLLS